MYNFRTDLALERTNIYRKANNLKDIEGIETQDEEIDNEIKVWRVKVTNEKGEQAIGKKKGTYITIDLKDFKVADDDKIQNFAKALSEELKKILQAHIGEKDDVLVVGLGNIYVTPDALRTKSY